MYRNPVIVQISDLHFGRSVKPYQFWKPSINEDAKKALKQAIVEIEPHPHFLVVTGDLANKGKLKEMKEARKYLESILDDLWKEGHATRCILVPGNHDVWRTTWARPSGYIGRRDRLQEWNQVFDSWSFLSPRIPKDKAEHMRPMSLLDYYRKHGEPDGEPAADSNDAQRLANEAMRVCEYFPAFRLAFLKLNSNVKLRRWKPGHIARGMVGLDQRHFVDEILRHYEHATQDEVSPFADARRIALVHHHVTRLPNVKQENWMLMDDAGEVARWLARRGVRLVLHGHYHKADLVGLTYWIREQNNSKAETIVIAAASATALDADCGHNSCHYIDLGYFRTRVFRPLLDHGEYQNLAVAASFEFVHKPNLKIADGLTERIPVFFEALEASVVGEEKYMDHKHIYTLVKSTGFIDASRNYFGSIELEGTNDTSQSTTDIPFVFTAVGAQYFHECDCRAWDLETGRELLKPQPIEDRPINVFSSRIYFADPLKPRESFRIRADFFLKMVMLQENDYDMLSLHRFPRGVAKMVMSLLSEKTIVAPKLLELRGDQLKPSRLPLQTVSKAPHNPSGKGQMNGYEVSIDSPPALCYLLFYERLA